MHKNAHICTLQQLIKGRGQGFEIEQGGNNMRGYGQEKGKRREEVEGENDATIL